MKISIIIPVLNEEKSLPETLKILQSFRHLGHEIIVVDGGSTDNSLVLADAGADAVIVSRPGRAVQMNSGAAVATGDVYLFLHADTVLPEDAVHLITTLSDDLFWGYFDIRLSSQKIIFRLIERMINFRSRQSYIATGDQAIFIERKLFKKIGGFPKISLMEDIAISRLLKDVTAPACLKSKVLTSSRRWESNGIIFTVLLMWKLRLYYFFGVSPERLNRLYR
ncbi:MAG: TIGR04283 family arsenosugar biosynthesis glycosyltransferase [Gammaproteobacteria bacterium]|nr:TIGR04283 family arsenosugar biosynthesis glycosyltransferase [Gammaproteobacteria bacterium]